MNFTYTKSVTILILWLVSCSFNTTAQSKIIIPIYLVPKLLGDSVTSIYTKKIEEFNHPLIDFKVIIDNDWKAILRETKQDGQKGIILASPRLAKDLAGYTSSVITNNFYKHKSNINLKEKYVKNANSIPLLRHVLVMYYKENENTKHCEDEVLTWLDLYNAADIHSLNEKMACVVNREKASGGKVTPWLIYDHQLSELILTLSKSTNTPIINTRGEWTINSPETVEHVFTLWKFHKQKLLMVGLSEKDVLNRFCDLHENVFVMFEQNRELAHISGSYNCPENNLKVSVLPNQNQNGGYYNGIDIFLGKNIDASIQKEVYDFLARFYTFDFQKEMVMKTGNFPVINLSKSQKIQLHNGIDVEWQDSYAKACEHSFLAKELTPPINHYENLKIFEGGVKNAIRVAANDSINAKVKIQRILDETQKKIKQ